MALEITRESLQQRYSDLTDAELLRRAHSGALTELAHDVALGELAQRGITPDAITSASSTPTIDEPLEFSPDEFERNPYQAPRTPNGVLSTSAPAPQRGGVWNVLWWIYFGYLCLMILTAVLQAAMRGTLPAFNVVHAVIYAVGAVGLAAWRLRRALLHPAVWVACLAAGLALISSGIKGLITTLNAADASSYNNPFVYVTAAFVLLNLPLFWALARYAFLSPSIWRRPARSPRTD
jgi:hypothetical protein